MSQCAQCGAQFSCGMADRDATDSGAPCWCTELPLLLGVPLEGTCLCPNCLRERLLQVQQGRDQPDAL
jgi:hypothetical protein